LRQWALDRISGLADALVGRRDDEMRKVVASYVECIELKPPDRTGVMVLNGRALPPLNAHDRPEGGRSWVNMAAGVGFDTDSPNSAWEEIEVEALAADPA